MTSNKENLVVDRGEGGLSAEQRSRISQNFRAAKALLARKRPRQTEPFNLSSPYPRKDGVGWENESPAQVVGIKRLPLSEIPMNAPSSETINLRIRNYNTDSCPRVPAKVNVDICATADTKNVINISSLKTPIEQSECCVNLSSSNDVDLNARQRDVFLKDGIGSDSFVTPVRQTSCSSLSEPLSFSTVLDDDFDESILEEIDALCNKSAAKSEIEVSNSIPLEIQHVSNRSGKENTFINLVLSDKKFNTESALNSSSSQECVSEVLRNSDTQVQSMPEEYAKYIMSLNERQREAACSDISIPLVIVAGPGSGKTSTMVGRVIMLLNQGICPSHILAMTFTTAAASEMRERIGAVAGKAKAKELTISTFHSFSLQLCRLHAEKLVRTPEFLVYGHGQQRRAVIEAIRLSENGKKKSNYKLQQADEVSGVSSPQYFKDESKKWLKYVTKAKAAGRTPEDCCRIGDERGADILRNYEEILKSCNALDYHDLISCSVKLLNEFPAVFKECQESWKAIVIDEFQDTSSMQYSLLCILASHKRITIVGDEDQSIFGFNGADVSGFHSFRKDFPMHKEVRLNKNYRSTRCIVEAASSLIRNNLERCESKDVLTDNSSGSKITVKECSNENSQCAFVVDKILEITSDGSAAKCNFGNIAVLYRRQVLGKIFQTTFRNRSIPFNIHGVAFYRKKVVRAIIAMLRTALPACDDAPYRKVFKALLPFEKEEKNKVIEHIDKVSTVRKCSFISAATDIFSAKISGTFKRTQLTQGRKVLLTLDMISKLIHTEQSISAVITSVSNMIPQRYLLEQRAVVDVDGGKLLNEDNDLRSVLQYLLDDVSDFLTMQGATVEVKTDDGAEGKGCPALLKAFIDYVSERERENFHFRRQDNKDSVTLTTIHQSKGLEWDVVFIIKVNETEIPLLHESNGVTNEKGSSVEEERRLLYVAMTRARKKLFILYLIMDSNWQILQPSRFLREIPRHLQEVQDEPSVQSLQENNQQLSRQTLEIATSAQTKTELVEVNSKPSGSICEACDEVSNESNEFLERCNANSFLRRFHVDDRGAVSQLFHQWAKKPAFQDPKRLLNKVGFVIDERLRAKKSNRKDVLRTLKSCLHSDEAFHFAISVLKWEQIPADKRAQLMREKQEHFQKQRIESAMNSSKATSKQIAYLQNLGCTVAPTSRLHASRLIEQYKSL
ncbi:ATP-dependent DNA helicase SRS2-like protein At4g25120 isoform X1 [Coffea arabica]|uniref:DNA 3'-5' helicase n=1 Tax=Coffea arabica TaxID=13443 RepID=A0A6P6VVY1_COFAR|nr:ATP-dependent DNA helicase SRS2-like protein At4g25120 isoform X1 [Coffea arabica]